jgi:hypothetical protein
MEYIKTHIKQRIAGLEQLIEKYTKNPNNITYSGYLLPQAQPKYYIMVGKLDAYKTVLRMIENQEEQKDDL